MTADRTPSREQTVRAIAGAGPLLDAFVLLAAAIALFIETGRTHDGVYAAVAGALLVADTLLCFGFFIVNPNDAMVLTFFGRYVGTVKENGFFWVNPFTI